LVLTLLYNKNWKTRKSIYYIYYVSRQHCWRAAMMVFLDYTPKTNPTEETAFVSYDNSRTYSWGLYGIFSNKVMKQFIDTSADRLTMADGDFQANYLSKSDGTNVQNNAWQWNNITPSMNTDDGWNFDFIRRVNVMLRNIDGSQMTAAEKDHWRSVGYFFRCYRYYDLLARYGDVPWLENVVSDEDMDILYGARTPRDEVAANILRDLQFAETHIKIDGDGQNTINQATVRALISRFCLFEGTWRKYHSLTGADTYLNECERVSKELLQKYPSIAPRYTDVWCSDDLGKVNGMILYKECLPDLIMSTFPVTKEEVHRSMACMPARWPAICARMVNLFPSAPNMKAREWMLP